MVDEHEEGTSSPGECPGCDAKRVWEEINPIMKRLANEAGRTPGEMAHHMICRYVTGMCRIGGVEQMKSLLVHMLHILAEHDPDAVGVQQEEGEQQTKH